MIAEYIIRFDCLLLGHWVVTGQSAHGHFVEAFSEFAQGKNAP